MSVRVRVTRQGGLAGIALRGEADTSELEGARAASAEAALRNLPRTHTATQEGHPDGFQYVLEFSTADHVRHSLLLAEAQVPSELQPLLDLAIAHSKLV